VRVNFFDRKIRLAEKALIFCYLKQGATI